MKPNKALSTLLRILIPLAVGTLILWLLYRNMDFDQILYTLRSDVDYTIIGISLLFGLMANTVRGLRWDILIRATGEKPRAIDSVLTTHGNYAVNMLLPRMGEVWRCGAMSHYSGIGFSKLFGTLLVDRVSDFVIVGLLLILTSISNLGFFKTFLGSHPALWDKVQGLLSSPLLYIALLTGVIGIWYIWSHFKHTRLVQKISSILSNIWQGLSSILHLQKKWTFILYSLLLWGGYFLFFYLTFFAFSFTAHLGLQIGLIAFVMSSIAVAAPVQAGLGAWHFMVIYTLTTFGVSTADAGSFAIIVHTIQTLFTTLVGLVAMALLPFLHKKASR